MTTSTRILEFDRTSSFSSYESAISLHSHTNRSREIMTPVPAYLDRIPVVSTLVRRQMESYARRNQREINFNEGWWQPPMTARALLDSETTQIARRLGLRSLVSITDHDDIGACLELRASVAPNLPISFEWTVPLPPGFLHLGVHNIPPADAWELFDSLAAFTAHPDAATLPYLLARVIADPETLLVLNHPLWDLARVGPLAHFAMLRRFMMAHGHAIHAVEINGYRAWKENTGAIQLAREYALPVVSGGDRHGRAPNSMLNLSNAKTFGGFARDVREKQESVVVILPEYRTSLVARKLAVISDATRRYPTYPAGQQRWTDRVFYDRQGTSKPLSTNWPTGGPLWVRACIRLFQFLTLRPVLPAMLAVVWLAGVATPDYTGPISVLDSVEASGASSTSGDTDATLPR